MTPDQIDLARRLVACPRWRWMPGMTAIPLSHERERWLLCWCEEDGSEAGGYQTTGGKWWGIATSDLPMVLREGWVPDLTDPATAGCLLAMLVAADPGAGWGVSCGPDVGWRATSCAHDLSGATCGEALARALLVVWEDAP